MSVDRWREPPRLFGVQIRVDPSWLIFAAFIGWTVLSGALQYLEGGQAWTLAILIILGFSLSILLHEMAHTLVGKSLRYRVDRITLWMFGGVAEFRQEPTTPMHEFLIAIAGPAMSVLLWLVLGQAAAFAGQNMVAVLALGSLAQINLMLALFNMIPAFPMDGGRVLRAIIWFFTGRLATATRIASYFGQAFAFLLIGMGAFAILQGSFTGLWYVLLGLMLNRMASRSRRAIRPPES